MYLDIELVNLELVVSSESFGHDTTGERGKIMGEVKVVRKWCQKMSTVARMTKRTRVTVCDKLREELIKCDEMSNCSKIKGIQ